MEADLSVRGAPQPSLTWVVGATGPAEHGHDVLGSSAETLREAGGALGSATLGAQGGSSPVYARTALPNPTYESAAPPPPPPLADRAEEPWDEVDELFAGPGS